LNDIWLLPLGVSAAGALILAAAAKKLNDAAASLRESMRPLRTRTPATGRSARDRTLSR
jgi:hypothetical protein